MLLVARKKVADPGQGIVWVQGRAESLPFKEEHFDCVTVGFALRHVTDLIGTVKEMVRVLKPGGRLAVVEFTRPKGEIAPPLLYTYLFGIVPPLLGLLIWNRRVVALARYLPVTIKAFVSAEGLRESLEAAGLTSVTVQPYMAGLVAVCTGVKVAVARSAVRNHLPSVTARGPS